MTEDEEHHDEENKSKSRVLLVGLLVSIGLMLFTFHISHHTHQSYSQILLT